MKKDDNKIIRIDFARKRKTERLNKNKDSKILNYFGINKAENDYKTIFPLVMMPYDLEADVAIIFEREFLVWLLMDEFKNKKIYKLGGTTVQCLLCYDADDLIDSEDYDLFVPDKVQECKRIFYLGNLDSDGINEFCLLKNQQELQKLEPWVDMYKIMIDRGLNNESNTFDLTERAAKENFAAFANYFNLNYRNKLNNLLNIDKKGVLQTALKIEDFR